jgi:hypothetical protein
VLLITFTTFYIAIVSYRIVQVERAIHILVLVCMFRWLAGVLLEDLSESVRRSQISASCLCKLSEDDGGSVGEV